MRFLLLQIMLLLAACAGPAAQMRADAQVDLARAYLKEGNTEAAVVALRRAMEHQRRHWAAWNHMGLALMQKGQFEDAEKAFRKSIRFSDGRAEPLVNYGVFLFHQGRIDEALEAYGRAMEDLTYRNTSLLMSNMGYALFIQQRYDEAEHILLQAVNRAPNFCTARYNLALVQRAQGRPDTALKTLDVLFEICGDQVVGAHLAAGELLMEQGASFVARQHLLKVIELQPETPLSTRANQVLDGNTGEPE